MKNATSKEDNGYQIIAVNIKYGGREFKTYKNRPTITTLDVPQSVYNIKDKDKFEEAIETFAYNTLTKRYGAEVSYCQIFLP